MNTAKRIIGSIVLITFLSQQTLPAGEPLVSYDQNVPQPVKSVEDMGGTIQTTPISQPHAIPDSTDFLQDSPLSISTADETPQSNPAYEYERYEFEDALDLLRPEFASAVIVKDLTEDDLKALLRLDFETAIVVLHGEIVLFSSGNSHEISLNDPARLLLEEASFISHTHPLDYHDSGPSAVDLEYMTKEFEFVISNEGIHAYTRDGLVTELSYSNFLARLHETKERSQTETHDPMKARELLNTFIKEIDALNLATNSDHELFRSAEVSAFTDDFNRTSLGSNWTQASGSFTTSNNTLFHSCCTTAGKLVLNAPLSSNDYDIQVKTYFVDGGSTAARGVLARYQDLNNYYYAKVGRFGQAYIVKKQNGVTTTLATGNTSWPIQNGWNTIRLTVEGSNLKLYFNGVLIFNVTDTASLTQGKVGIGSDVYYERLDDFSVTTLGSSPPIPDTTPPNISAVVSSSITSTGATITWTTNESSDSQVEYRVQGTTTWLANTINASLVTAHSMNLTGLNASTVYEYRVKSKDQAGNQAIQPTISTLMTLAPPDITAPVVSGITSTSITSAGATITWITNEASDTQIEYGLTTSYGSSTTLNTALVTSHSQALSTLQASTLYHYRVKSKDAAGNLQTSADFTFSTLVPPDTTPPNISAVVSSSVTSTGATITWTTNEASDSQVQYRLQGTITWTNSALNTSMVTSHSVSLTGLNVSTTYEYQVKSRDQAGNLAIQPTISTFATQASPPQVITEPGLISYWNFDQVSGNQTSDLTGTGNNGTLVNGATLSPDHSLVNFANSGSLIFDGINGYAEVVNHSSINFGSGDFTIGLWIKPDTVTQTKQGILNKSDGTNGYRLITSDTDGDRLKFIRGAFFADGVQSNDGALKAGVWQYVTVVISNNQVTFYVNGVNQGGGTLASKSASTTTNLFIGQKGYSASSVNFFDGNMDDLRLYNRAISYAEVQALASGNLYSTQASPDTQAPMISAVTSTSITSTGATINWTTDELSDSQVEYRVQGSATWSATTLNSSLVTNHSITLTGLNPSTTYEYRVKSKDQAGNQAIQPTISTLMTLAPPDTTPPNISAVSSSNITSTGATISWTTDELSDSQVEYRVQGTTTWLPTTLNSTLLTNHSITLTGLNPSTTYEYQVKSRDQAGNQAIQPTISTLMTLAPPIPATGVKPPLRVNVYSSGFDDGNFSEIYVDGVSVINIKKRGFTFAVIDEVSGQVLEVKSFDTYTSSANADAMAAYIQSIPQSRYVAVTVADEGSYYLNQNAKNALFTLGIATTFTLRFRDSYAAIGRKGLSSGQAVEFYSPRYKGSAVVQAGPDEPEPVVPGAFLENQGMLVIGAEHAQQNVPRGGKSWTLQTAQAGFSGEGYFLAGSDTGTTVNTGYLTLSPELRFDVFIETPGVYYVWVRGRAVDTNNDTVHVGLDGLPFSSSDRISFTTYNSFTWSKSTLDSVAASINITLAGAHTLNIWMREDGFILDKIILTNDPNFTPTSYGPVESSRAGSTPPPDTTPPTISAVVSSGITSTGALISWTTNEASDSQVEYRVQGTTTWLPTTLNSTLLTNHSITLTGLNPSTTYEYQVKSRDQAGNLKTLDGFTITTSQMEGVPQIEFVSPNVVTSSTYEFTYSVNGNQTTQTVVLSEGANLLTVKESNASGTIEAHYLVILNQLVDISAVAGQSPALELSDVSLRFTLYDIEFQNGEVWKGTFKTESGDWYRVEEGILREVLRPDGVHTFFSANGRVSAIVFSDDAVMNFTYQTDRSGNLTGSILTTASEQITLNAGGMITKVTRSSGESVFFNDDLLSEVITENQLHRFYASEASGDGFRVSLERIENASGAKLLFLNGVPFQAFDSLGGTLNLTSEVLASFGWGAEANVAVELKYDLTKELTQFKTSKNLTFIITNNAVTKVIDSKGVETNYSLTSDPLGFNTELSVVRDAIERTYAFDGTLRSLTLDDGTKVEYEGQTPVRIVRTDESFFTDLQFDETTGTLKAALYHTPEGWRYQYENEILAKSFSPEGLIRSYDSAGKIVRLETSDGRVYTYTPAVDGSGTPIMEAILTEFRTEDGTRVLVDSNQRIIAQEFVDGIRLSYSYDGTGKVIHVVSEDISGASPVLLDTYIFSYVDGKTHIQRSSGAVRIYDSSDTIEELLLPDGKKYCYVPGEGGDLIQSLCEIESSALGKVSYQEGKPSTIELTNGPTISSIVLNTDNTINSAAISYPDGLIGMIQNSTLAQLLEPGGLGHEFENGVLVRIIEEDGTITNVTYNRDSAQNLVSISLTNSGIVRTYTPEGVLSQVKLDNGTTFHYSNGLITETANSKGDKFYFASGGSLTGLDLIGGTSLRNAIFNTLGQLLSGTITVPGGDQHIISNGVVAEVRKSNGTRLFYSGGLLTRIEEPDQDKFFYTNGALTRIERSNGDYLTPASLDGSDRILTGNLYPHGASGRIAKMTGEILPDGARTFASGTISQPSGSIASPSSATAVFGGPTSSFLLNRPAGEFVFQSGSPSGGPEWDGAKFSFSPSITGAGYFKVTIGPVSGAVAPSEVNFNGRIYTLQGFGTYYFEVPSSNISSLTLTFPASPPSGTLTGLSLQGAELVGSQSQDASSWTNMATGYGANKISPLVSSEVYGSLSQAAFLKADSGDYFKPFSFTAVDLSSEGWRVNQANASVLNAILPGGSFIGGLYDVVGNLKEVARLGAAAMDSPTASDLALSETKLWNKIDLALKPLPSLDPNIAFKMHFSPEGNLIRSWRADAQSSSFEEGKIKRLTTPDGEVIEYQYSGDSPDSLDQVNFTPDSTSSSQISIDYDLGAIRSVSKDGKRIYDYSYEFDSAGKQTTLLNEVQTNQIRRYQDDLLWSVKNTDTGMDTEYTYDDQDRVKTATVSRAGRIFGTYQYSYNGDETLIQDDSGTTRIYDTSGTIKRLITPSGEYYDYSPAQDSVTGTNLIVQNLSLIKDPLLGDVSYENGLPKTVVRPDGTVLNNIVLDENFGLLSARADFPDDAVGFIEGGMLVRLVKPDGSEHIFTNGQLTQVRETNGTTSTLTHNRDSSQNLISISIANSGTTRTYNPQGLLIQVVQSGTTFDYSNGVLTQVITSQGDRYFYASDGSITGLSLSSGLSLSGASFNSSGQLVSGTIVSGGDTYIVSGGVITEVRKPTGARLIYSGSSLTQVEEADRDKIFYTNGVLNRIEKDNTISRGGSVGPDIVTPLTWDSSDRVLTGWIDFEGRSGRIARTTGELLQEGVRLLSNGSTQEPAGVLLTPSSTGNVFGGGTTSFQGNVSEGRFEFKSNNSTSVEWDGIKILTSGSFASADYLKVLLNPISGVNLPSQVRVEFFSSSSSTTPVYSKTYSFQGQGIYFFEIPDGLGSVTMAKLTFPVGPPQSSVTGLMIQQIEFLGTQVQDASSWANIAMPYVSVKSTPPFPTAIFSGIPAAQAKRQEAANFPVNFEITQSDRAQANARYEAAKSWLAGTIPSDDFVISAAYDESGEVARIVRGDRTVTTYLNGQVERIETLDGELISSYTYDSNGDLIGVHLADARRNYPLEVQKAKDELERQKVDLLNQLAQQHAGYDAAIMAEYQSGLNSINEQRRALEASRFQEVCKNFLFWKSCTIVEVDIPNFSELMADLARQERELWESTQQALADVAEEVRIQRAQIEADAVTAFQELEVKALELYHDLVKQELSPIVYHHYRVILGRDPGQSEVDVWVNPQVSLEQINVAALRSALLQSQEYDRRLREVNQVKAGVQAFLLEYVEATDARKLEMVQALGLQTSEIIPLPRSEIDEILKWLNSRDLHFGHSATLALKRILTSEGYQLKGLNPDGLDQDFIEITRDTVLMDVLVGVIHPLTQGDLELSVFSLVRYGERHGVTLYQAKIDLNELKKQVALGEEVIAHVNGNHFIVVTAIDDEKVTYHEINIGSGGGTFTKTIDEFRATWDGAVITAAEPLDPQTLLTDEEAKEITGAFFGAIWDFIKGIFNAIKDAIFTVVNLITNVISAIVTIVKSIVEFTLNAIVRIGQELVNFGKRIFEAVRLVGSFILKVGKAGFQFLKNAVAHFGQFLSLTIQGIKAGYESGGFWGLIAASILFPVINLGKAIGLIALDLVKLGGTILNDFINGGVLGALFEIGGLLNFALAGIPGLIAFGVQILGRALNLPPIFQTAFTNMGSLLVGNFITGDFGLLESIKNVLPTAAKEFGLAGITALAGKLGLPSALTQLIGIPISTRLGDITRGLFSGDPGGIFNAIKNVLISGANSIGFNFGGKTTDPLFGSLKSGDILSSVESALGLDGLFSNVFNLIRETVLTPFNVVNGTIQTIFEGIKSFGSIIQEKGLVGALESFASSIFSQSTLEKILNGGGFSGLLGSAARVATTLITGEEGDELKLDDNTSLFFLFGNFIGKKESGVTQIGTFGVDPSGKWGLIAGKVIGTIVGFNNLAFAADVMNGQLGRFTISDALGNKLLEGNPDGTGPVAICGPEGNCPTDIPGPGPEPSPNGGSFWNVVFQILPFAVELLFGNGVVRQIEVSNQPSSGDPPAETDTLFALTNGFLNTELFSAPGYLLNLLQDIVTQSESQVEPEDIILAPTFFSSALIGAGNLLGLMTNLFKLNPWGLVYDATVGQLIDMLLNLIKNSAAWIDEMISPSTYATIATNIRNALEHFFSQNPDDRSRELVGVAHSGGFLPLGEVLANSVYKVDTNTGYNAVSLVGLGGANIQLDGPYRQVLDKIVEVGEFLLKGTVKTAEFLSNLRIELDALAVLASGPAGLASLSQAEVDQIYQALTEGTIESAYQLFIAKAQEKIQAWSAFAPSLAATSNIGVVVNVYGTQDILTKLSVGGQTIGGYRDSIGDYVIGSKTKALVNIEIVGASHYDYIRPEEKSQWWQSGLLGAVSSAVDWFTTTEDEIWNKTVSEFVAQLINNSQSADDIEQFLNDNPTIASFDGQKWIIKLPGWESRA